MSVDTEKESQEDVYHAERFFQNFESILEQPELSDVTLIVEGCSFPAHKVVLAAQSEYFKALIFGGLKESSEKEIVLKDPKNKTSFKILLNYIYTARMSLHNTETSLLLDVLELSQKWNLQKLTDAICGYLELNLTVEYLWEVHTVADKYGFEKLSQKCMIFAGCNAVQVVQHKSFLQISPTVMKEIISHDTFFAPEELIFERLCIWITEHTEVQDDLEDTLRHVRWPQINTPDFLRIFKTLNAENRTAVMGMILDIYNPKHSKATPRNYGLPGVNVATAKRGARVVEPNGASQIAVGDKSEAEGEDGCTSSLISIDGDQAIVVELDRKYLLNFIKIEYKTSWDYSYYIEVSEDRISWLKIVDYRDFYCFGSQRLYFDTKLVRYIKVVGTKIDPTDGTSIRVSALEAYFLRDAPAHFDKKTGFFVSENEELKRRIHIGDLKTSGCTLAARHEWHWRVGNEFYCYFQQPIMTSHVEILLFDPSSSGGDYRVDVTKDELEWKEIGTLSSCASWKTLKFDVMALTHFRISRPQGAETIPLCLELKCLRTAKGSSGEKK